jgi:predicted component of type VI protein secretion system
LKHPKVKDAILNKLLENRPANEIKDIKLDFEKIQKIQDEKQQQVELDAWIKKWNIEMEKANKAMQNRLPEEVPG